MEAITWAHLPRLEQPILLPQAHDVGGPVQPTFEPAGIDLDVHFAILDDAIEHELFAAGGTLAEEHADDLARAGFDGAVFLAEPDEGAVPAEGEFESGGGAEELPVGAVG